MDNLAHSLVGLTAAKAGLERLSSYATTVCVISANAADADFVSLFFGDRWTLLQHHRGITHSLIGTLGIALLVPTFAFLIERVVCRIRGRAPRIRFGGLLLASSVAAATHPFMDWTNNYGVRPFLPWSSRWFYGDLVFIVDPYIWLGLGAVGFLLSSDKRWKLYGWSLIGLIATLVLIATGLQPGPESTAVKIALAVWLVGVLTVIMLRVFRRQRHFDWRSARAALALLVLYWSALGLAHRTASEQTIIVANSIAANRAEGVIRTATMPSEASPLRWQSVAETESAFYRFSVVLESDRPPANGSDVTRFEKPAGPEAQLISLAEQDRRARALLGFARFPMARVSPDNCIGQALVQFADLRYTEPGRGRGNFSVNIPVDCPSR
jgi:inner membrane protein